MMMTPSRPKLLLFIQWVLLELSVFPMDRNLYQKKERAEQFVYPIRTGGGGVFSTPSRFSANNFGSNKGTQLKLSDFPEI